MQGPLSSKDMTNFRSLEILDMSGNMFTGILSSYIGTLSSLKAILLSQNKLHGNLHAKGLFSFSSFANHSKLKVIRFKGENYRIEDGNKIVSEGNTFEIETENPSWESSFQLKVLVLPNCDLNKLSSKIPKFLFYQQELELVDISHNRLKGSFPVWLIENNTRLQLLNLRDNYFGGQFYLPIDQCSNLSWLDFSNNNFNGQLHENIGKMIPNLQYLNISQNHFEGFLPSSIGDMSNLEKLDLSNNNFSGEVPMKLVANCTSLVVLKLSYNKFHGKIFSEGFRFFNSTLRILELKNNHLTGTLPTMIDAFDGLTEPNSTFLEFRDIIVPYQSILKRNFENFEVEREVAAQIGIEFVMKYRSYFYKGGILDLMSLTGSIPNTFSKLTQLESLDLSHNNLSGEIPSTLIDLHFLEVFNVAYNNLSSKVPDMKEQFGTFQNSSYEGNPFLCGPPLEKSCTRVDKSPPSPIKSSDASHGKWYDVDPLVFSTTFIVSF
ncbi:receptor-like protein 8, partial [Quercus suber]